MKKFILFCTVFCYACSSPSDPQSCVIKDWICEHFNDASYEIVEVSELAPIIHTSQQLIVDLQPLLYSDDELKYAPEYIKIRHGEIKRKIEELQSNPYEKIVGYSCICKFNILTRLGTHAHYEYVFKFDELGNIVIVEDTINDVEIFNAE